MLANYLLRRTKLDRVRGGEPAGEAVAAEAKLLGAQRVLVLSNRSLAREEKLLASIAEELGERCAGTFTGIRAHSQGVDIIAAVKMAKEVKADLVVAVGGGSVIDATKIVVVCLIEGINTLDALKARPQGWADVSRWPKGVPADSIRYIAVPTTLASAEFVAGAGFIDTIGEKRSFAHPLMAAQVIILDPRATLTTPDELFFGTATRILDRAAAFMAGNVVNPFSETNSFVSAQLMVTALRRVKADRTDLAARFDAQTSMWVGTAGHELGVPTAAGHVIGRVIGVVKPEVPHGVTSCVLAPAVMRWNEPANAARQKRVAEAFGAPDKPVSESFAALIAEIGMPGRLRDVGITRDLFPQIAQMSFESPNMRANPRPVRSAADVTEILELAW